MYVNGDSFSLQKATREKRWARGSSKHINIDKISKYVYHSTWTCRRDSACFATCKQWYFSFLNSQIAVAKCYLIEQFISECITYKYLFVHTYTQLSVSIFSNTHIPHWSSTKQFQELSSGVHNQCWASSSRLIKSQSPKTSGTSCLLGGTYDTLIKLSKLIDTPKFFQNSKVENL